MTAALSTDALARRLARLEKRLDSISGPQLAYSSIEDGAVNEYDIDGQLSSTIGRQYDGTHGAVVLAGPIPPTPFGAIVASIPIGIIVRWEGGWIDLPNPDPGLAPTPVVAPQDFARIEVHVSTDPSFTGLFFSTLRATIESARGGDVQIPIVDTETDVYVRLVARASSGKASAPSAVTGPIRPGKVPTASVDIDWDSIGGNTIFVGEDEPTTDKIGDLWLSEPDNIAHRWDGTDWVELRDQGVVQAITDAYNAQQAAGQAGIDALAAQQAAEDAGDAAGAAQIDADQALSDAAAASGLATTAKNTADAKITVYRQASAPTGGTYKVNADLWIDSDDGKLYVTTTTAGAWVEAGDQRIATALSTATGKTTVFAQTSAPSTTGRTAGDQWIDIDDGNKVYVWDGAWTARTFGAAAISATARQLGAITTYKQATAPASGMIVGDFWIDSDDNKIYRYEGTTPTWVASQDTAINTAITNAATAQSTADGAVRMFFQDSAPTGLNNTTHVGDVWIETDAGNRSWSWSGTAWTDKRIGNAAITPNSLVASNVVATGTITAALLETQLVLASTIIAGDPTGGHARMTSSGFFGYALGPDGPYIATKLGTTDNDTLTLTDSTGAIKAAIDVTGKIVGRALSITEWPILGGVDLKAYIDDGPRGLMRWGTIPATATGGTVGEASNSKTTFWGMPGRMYRVSVGPVQGTSTVAGDYIQAVIRYTTNGSDPVSTSNFLSYSICQHNNTMQMVTLMQVTGTVGTPVPVQLRLNYSRNFGSGNVTIGGAGGYFIIEDIGPVNAEQIISALGNTGGTGQVQTYETDFSPTWWRVWRGNNTLISMGNDLYQGYEATNGNMKSMVGFSDMTPTLSGATINRMWVYLYAEHWWNAGGGIPVIGAHGNMSDTITWPSGAGAQFSGPAMARGEGRWVELPSSWFASFKTGTWRGLVFGPGWDNNAQYYGRFDAPSLRIRINYTK